MLSEECEERRAECVGGKGRQSDMCVQRETIWSAYDVKSICKGRFLNADESAEGMRWMN